jgi:hypothetical protein
MALKRGPALKILIPQIVELHHQAQARQAGLHSPSRLATISKCAKIQHDYWPCHILDIYES